jgi:hypothetical protein
MANQGQSRADLEVLPPWVVDPEVKIFLESEGFEIAVLRDEKSRPGLLDKPLIVLRRISPPKQYYLYVDGDSAYEM